MANQEIAGVQILPDKWLKLIHGDITKESVDAIVNAANSQLKHGGGVAAAIVRQGGYEIQQESDRIGYVPVGGAAITGAGKLPARFVIHAVGPRWGEGHEDQKLRNAVWNSLKLALERQFQTISFPAISAGIFGFPKERCARIILTTIEEFIRKYPDCSLKEVRVCLFDAPTLRAFQEAFQERFGDRINTSKSE